jgi:hypothetical protein
MRIRILAAFTGGLYVRSVRLRSPYPTRLELCGCYRADRSNIPASLTDGRNPYSNPNLNNIKKTYKAYALRSVPIRTANTTSEKLLSLKNRRLRSK